MLILLRHCRLKDTHITYFEQYKEQNEQKQKAQNINKNNGALYCIGHLALKLKEEREKAQKHKK